MVTIKEAARQLGVSERHLQRMISEGLWPAYRAGKRIIRVDIDEIRAKMRSDFESSLKNGGRSNEGL